MAIVIDFTLDDAAIQAGTLFKRVGYLLQDEEHVRWTLDELIEWFNEAQVAVINANPSAGERDAILTLDRGARQDLSNTVCQLISITCNVDASGMAGRAITRTDFSLMSQSAPDWQSGKRCSTVRQYMFDDRTPGVFYVYPPAAENIKVRASMVTLPEAITQAEDNLTIRSEYADAVVNYMCYRCLAKDSEYSNGQIAAAYYSAFQTAMGAEAQGAGAVSPNASKP